MLNNHLLDGTLPQLTGFEIRGLLLLPGSPFGPVVDLRERSDVRKTGDAVDGAGAEVDLGGPGRRIRVVTPGLGGNITLEDEAVSVGDEGLGVGGGGAVVDVLLWVSSAINSGQG